jgi:hypothetical protein
MKPIIPLLLLPLALAACGKSEGNASAGGNRTAGNATAAAGSATTDAGGNAAGDAAVAPAMAGGDRLQAGQWELSATVQSLDAAGLPPQQQAAMRQRIGRPLTHRICMTEAQARDFGHFTTPPQGSGCSIGDRVYAGGVIRLNVSCPAPGGRPGTIQMSTEGHYTPTSLDMTLHQQLPNAGPGGGQVRLTTVMSGRRIGPCPAGGTQSPPIPVRPQAGAVPVIAPPPSPR